MLGVCCGRLGVGVLGCWCWSGLSYTTHPVMMGGGRAAAGGAGGGPLPVGGLPPGRVAEGLGWLWLAGDCYPECGVCDAGGAVRPPLAKPCTATPPFPPPAPAVPLHRCCVPHCTIPQLVCDVQLAQRLPAALRGRPAQEAAAQRLHWLLLLLRECGDGVGWDGLGRAILCCAADGLRLLLSMRECRAVLCCNAVRLAGRGGAGRPRAFISCPRSTSANAVRGAHGAVGAWRLVGSSVCSISSRGMWYCSCPCWV